MMKLLYTLIFLSTILQTIASERPVILIVGTRPEAIKMIPVYHALQESGIPTLLCSTGQHTNLLDDIFKIFNIEPDFKLNIMKPGQDLFHITNAVLTKLKDIFEQTKPSMVLVQGDTTSAMAGALAAFYCKIPIGHIEAGLRTGNIYAPYPEEMNRRLIGTIATYHFATTPTTVKNLANENIDPRNIYCVGNTVVDALIMVRSLLHNNTIAVNETVKNTVAHCKAEGKKLMLFTAHRRESFGDGLDHIFHAVKTALELYPNLFIIYPTHPNPAITQALHNSNLDTMSNIIITKPLEYPDMVYLLDNVDLVLTDSGGIQEEAASLNKRVLVLRNETDRPEIVHAGFAMLVGTDEDYILNGINMFLHAFAGKTQLKSPYGDGTSAKKIAEIIAEKLSLKE
jgi:UDP-N-acetylglucosamine 2-epimerase (non-hydrolysing)